MTLVNVIRPNVVICDAGIPDLPTGKVALEKLRQSGPGIQVLHLSSEFSATEAGRPCGSGPVKSPAIAAHGLIVLEAAETLR
jgi:hypothetical protein